MPLLDTRGYGPASPWPDSFTSLITWYTLVPGAWSETRFPISPSFPELQQDIYKIKKLARYGSFENARIRMRVFNELEILPTHWKGFLREKTLHLQLKSAFDDNKGTSIPFTLLTKWFTGASTMGLSVHSANGKFVWVSKKEKKPNADNGGTHFL